MEESIYPWHTENWEYLQRMMDKLPHALLFYGPTGTGIETFAESFAKSMLCENRPSGGQPCASCQSCHWFDQYAHPDYRQILPETLEIARGIQNADKTASTDEEPATGKTSREPSRKIGIDKIRSLADFMQHLHPPGRIAHHIGLSGGGHDIRIIERAFENAGRAASRHPFHSGHQPSRRAFAHHRIPLLQTGLSDAGNIGRPRLAERKGH